MSDKLGFTFYPKDWWTSDTFFELTQSERYIFLECMFVMYQNDGIMKTQKTQIENRIRLTISDIEWLNVTERFLLIDGMFTLLSVNKRLKKAISSMENGKLGGRPKGSTKKPKEPKAETHEETQKNPPLEREEEREREEEKKDELKVAFPTSNIYSIKDFEKVEIGENEFTMLAVRRSNKKMEEIKPLFDEFISDQKAVNKIAWQDEPDAKKHFLNWVGKKKTSPSGRGLVR